MLQFKDIVMYIEKFHNITDSNQSNGDPNDFYMKFDQGNSYQISNQLEGGEPLWSL